MGRGKKIDDVAIVAEVATRMIEERGIEEFSTRRLAAALRISAMTLYNYFADREAILKAVAVRCLEDFNRSMAEEIAAASGEPASNPMYAFQTIARRLFALGLAKPRLYLFLFDSSEAGVRGNPEVSEQYHTFVEGLVTSLVDPSTAEELRKDVLLFELLANSLAISTIRWPGSISESECHALLDRAYGMILSPYEGRITRPAR